MSTSTDTLPTDSSTKTTTLTPLETIDACLKGGDWLDELERAKLLDERETRYLLTGAAASDFIKDTSEKTGITRSVLQRVRRITRLPKEVMARLVGTKIANRQDLLVQLSDRVAPMDLETALAAMTADKQEFAGEAADLLYHLIVLLRVKKLALADAIAVLERRHGK
jgi:hypothetical protein